MKLQSCAALRSAATMRCHSERPEKRSDRSCQWPSSCKTARGSPATATTIRGWASPREHQPLTILPGGGRCPHCGCRLASSPGTMSIVPPRLRKTASTLGGALLGSRSIAAARIRLGATPSIATSRMSGPAGPSSGRSPNSREVGRESRQRRGRGSGVAPGNPEPAIRNVADVFRLA